MIRDYTYHIESDFIPKALQYAQREQAVVYLNPNSYQYPHQPFKHILAFGVKAEVKVSTDNFSSLELFLQKYSGNWVLGYLSYDLKNESETLSSMRVDQMGFPLVHFFVPRHLLFFDKEQVSILSDNDAENLYKQIEQTTLDSRAEESSIDLKPLFSKEEYIKAVKDIQIHIQKGDLYEMNFCQGYYGENVVLNPVQKYWDYNSLSPMPFSSFVKFEERYVLCASPERFLKKSGNTLISQPIKGTARRLEDTKEDEIQRSKLRNSDKERTENIMIVDLVRNDLSKITKAGSVKVEELCGLYSFPKVHQLISTVSGTLDDDHTSVDSLRHTFPMGSMTGAPKRSALEIIEAYEKFARGIFSGSIGYFSPKGDFDFNVVIRSIVYNKETRLLSYQVGSAITAYADAEKEYEECAVKTEAIRAALRLK